MNYSRNEQVNAPIVRVLPSLSTSELYGRVDYLPERLPKPDDCIQLVRRVKFSEITNFSGRRKFMEAKKDAGMQGMNMHLVIWPDQTMAFILFKKDLPNPPTAAYIFAYVEVRNYREQYFLEHARNG